MREEVSLSEEDIAKGGQERERAKQWLGVAVECSFTFIACIALSRMLTGSCSSCSNVNRQYIGCMLIGHALLRTYVVLS